MKSMVRLGVELNPFVLVVPMWGQALWWLVCLHMIKQHSNYCGSCMVLSLSILVVLPTACAVCRGCAQLEP
ncbi:hypothetical protein COO60DRAFT_1516860 [Scenedesmus sp. NREL 46B-D3]|nr:hypothetical protein COO60DRAFT_1516860 [Scenedesmus sp. NREL 46B-D3]